MRIVSFKVLTKEVNAQVLVTDKDGTVAVDPKKRKAPVHDDMKAALNLLKPHLIVLFGIVKYKDWEVMSHADREDLLGEIHPHGYALGGEDHDEGVTLTGHRIIDGGFSTNLVTPYRRFQEKPETAYPEMEKLQEALAIIDKEAKGYLDGSKRGTNGQQNLPFQEGEKAGMEKKHVKTPVKKEVVTKMHIANPVNDDEGGGILAGGIPSADLNTQAAMKDEEKKTPAGGKKRVPQTAKYPSGIPKTE